MKHLANTSILDSSSSLTEPFVSDLPCCIFPICPGPEACCLPPTTHISHVHPLLTTGQLTIIQVNNMSVLHLMYNGHIYSTSHTWCYPSFSLHLFYTLGQAGWPQPLMSGTTTNYRMRSRPSNPWWGHNHLLQDDVMTINYSLKSWQPSTGWFKSWQPTTRESYCFARWFTLIAPLLVVVSVPGIHRLNFERLNFKRPNFERLNFERPNFERLNFEKDSTSKRTTWNDPTWNDWTSNRTHHRMRLNFEFWTSNFEKHI